MAVARPDTSGKTTTPLTHSCSNHGVIQVGSLGSDAMFEVIDVRFVRLLLQYIPRENYENELNIVKVVSFLILTNLYFRIHKVVQQRN